MPGVQNQYSCCCIGNEVYCAIWPYSGRGEGGRGKKVRVMHELKPPKTWWRFLKFIWEQFGIANPCSSTLATKTTFWQGVFSEFWISSILKENFNFLWGTIALLNHLSVLLMILILFDQFWCFSKVLDEVKRSKRPKFSPVIWCHHPMLRTS